VLGEAMMSKGKSAMNDRRSLAGSLTLCLAGVLAVSLLSAGCTTKSAKSSQTQWTRSEIYCGLDKPAGGVVTDTEFADFLSKVVTPAFPAGMTVLDAYGQMQDSSKNIVKQHTRVILLVHEKSQANSDAIQKVISSYRSTFSNPQVMYLQSPTQPQFFGN
jgi:Protein of unknown function (DUF3574)